MPTYTFTESDLHLTQERLGQLRSACASDGLSDPIASAIEEAVASVNGMTANYVLDPVRWKRFVRSVARFSLFTSAGELSDSEDRAYQSAWKELTGIRDGAEPTLPTAAPPPSPMAPGNWGSGPALRLR